MELSVATTLNVSQKKFPKSEKVLNIPKCIKLHVVIPTVAVYKYIGCCKFQSNSLENGHSLVSNHVNQLLPTKWE